MSLDRLVPIIPDVHIEVTIGEGVSEHCWPSPATSFHRRYIEKGRDNKRALVNRISVVSHTRTLLPGTSVGHKTRLLVRHSVLMCMLMVLKAQATVYYSAAAATIEVGLQAVYSLNAPMSFNAPASRL